MAAYSASKAELTAVAERILAGIVNGETDLPSTFSAER